MENNNPVLNSLHFTLLDILKGGPLKEMGMCSVLQDETIHVLTAQYTDLYQHFQRLSHTLSETEMQKAHSFRHYPDFMQYSIRTGVLRTILGFYTNVDPKLVRFITEKNGKPNLDPQSNIHKITFNLSHTPEMILVGITRRHQIGVDLVKNDPVYPFQEAAEYLFSPEEKAVLNNTNSGQQSHVFFRIWSLKEALLKAQGGSVLMMRTTDVSGLLQKTSRLSYHSSYFQDMGSRFFMFESVCGNGHHCTIAIGPIPLQEDISPPGI
jgi:4'-phosphopantetheinyl transferase